MTTLLAGNEGVNLTLFTYLLYQSIQFLNTKYVEHKDPNLLYIYIYSHC